MFFSNIKEYSNRKLSAIYWISLISYFLIMLVGPFVIICNNYEVFRKSEVSALTGLGICVVLALVIVGLKLVRPKIDLLPENTVNQRRVKFSILLIYSLVIPVVVWVILGAMHSNFDLAFRTCRDCLIFFTIGIVSDNLILKYVESERTLRFETQRDVEKTKETESI